MHIYRFELSFDGEEQDVGLLHGWSDTLYPGEEPSGLLAMFETLPVPKLDDVENSRAVFWFTEEGLREYSADLRIIINVVWDHSPWGVIVRESEVSEEVLKRALYLDPWQIAWRYEEMLDSDSFCLDYQEIHSPNEIIQMM